MAKSKKILDEKKKDADLEKNSDIQLEELRKNIKAQSKPINLVKFIK